MGRIEPPGGRRRGFGRRVPPAAWITAGAVAAVFAASEIARRAVSSAPPSPLRALARAEPAKGPEKAQATAPSAKAGRWSDVEITRFATRDWHGEARQIEGEVINRGTSRIDSVKIRVSCELEGRHFSQVVDETDPAEIPPLGTAVFQGLIPLPWATDWTAQVIGSDQIVSETPVAPPEPPSRPALAMASPPPSKEPASFSIGEWSWYFTSCCKVVRGTVYNRGEQAGTAPVRITGSSNGQVVVDQVVSVHVDGKSEGFFEQSFPGTPAEDWAVDLATP